MTEQEQKKNEAGRDVDGAGDVEAAGETTAAATIGGDNTADTRPVGTDTQVRVEGDPPPAEGGGE